MRVLAIVSGIAWLPLLLAACGTATGTAAGSAGVKEITVQASEFQFEPSAIELNVGERVRLTFRNADSVEHDLSVMELPMSGPGAHAGGGHDGSSVTQTPQLHLFAANGQKNSIEFTPTQPGAYPVICTAAGHQRTGMLGTLVVK